MKIPVEMPFFLVIFAFMLSDPVTVNLIVYRTCYLTMDFNRTVCGLLGLGKHDNRTTKIEEEVQPYVTVLSMSKYLIETVVGAVLCFFIGPWSDKYGRRPILLLTLGGYTLGYLVTTVISALPNASPWFLLLSTIPICLVGGFPAYLTATICHISDSTTQENRGFRMGIFEAVISSGAFLGTISCSFLFNAYGYVTVYSITTLCIFLAWLSVALAGPEAINHPESEGKFRNLFKFSLVTNTISTTFKRREGSDRALLIILLTLMIVFLLACTADGSIVFLYLRRKLDWSLKTYTLYSAVRSLGWISGSIIGGYLLHKLLRVEETILVLIGFLSMMTTAILQGLAWRDWHMYIAGGTKCFGSVISPMCRSLISKIVPSEECGTVFSFLVISETLINLIGSPVYTYLYNRTILTLPGVFNFVTAGIFLAEVVLTIPAIAMQIRRSHIRYQRLKEQNVTIEN